MTSGGDPVQSPGDCKKRRDILRLSLDDYRRWADKVTEAYLWAGQFLAQEHIYRAEDIPYRTQLVPLAAIRVIIGDQVDLHGSNQKLRLWYWCGVLGELYGGSIETRFARDVEQIVDWIEGGPQLGTVTEASFRVPDAYAQ